MIASKEYLDSIASKLERLNPGLEQSMQLQKKDLRASSGILDGIGKSGLDYMKATHQKLADPGPDPLFPDRNDH